MERDLTLNELAVLTGRHPETLRRLARAGKLPGAYRLGRCWMISRAASDRLRCITACGSETGRPAGSSRQMLSADRPSAEQPRERGMPT